MEHPTPDVLLRFLLGAASRPESRQVVRHLLARCSSCAAALRELRSEPPLGPPPGPEVYDPAFDRAAAFLRKLSQNGRPAAEAGRRPDTGASGNAARRRWRFG